MRPMIQVQPVENETVWNERIKTNGGHPLQLWGWGSVKAAHGWRVDRVEIVEGTKVIAVAQLLIKQLPKPFNALVYIPRGPVFMTDNAGAAREALTAYCKRTYQPVAISAEPDTVSEKPWQGWRRSKNRILLARTATLDLTKPEDELLSVMSKKTRQYIRKSAGENIEVTTATSLTDIEECMAIYKATAQRAGFALHTDEYYRDIFIHLKQDSPVYVARHKGRVVSFLWPIVTPEVAFELYGGMNEEGQNLRANYHLKWSVIQTMRSQGIRRYDVNGLLNDGVTTFKKGFIPEETIMSGTFDKPLSPFYMVYAGLLPAVKRLVQKIR